MRLRVFTTVVGTLMGAVMISAALVDVFVTPNNSAVISALVVMGSGLIAVIHLGPQLQGTHKLSPTGIQVETKSMLSHGVLDQPVDDLPNPTRRQTAVRRVAVTPTGGE